MDIRCKVCGTSYHCPADLTSEECSGFAIDVDELTDIASKIAERHGVKIQDALCAIELGLRFGGSIDD